MSTDIVSAYVEHTKLFFAANSITAERQVPIFLNAIGKTNYQLLRNLLSPSLKSEAVQKKLLTKTELTFQKAINQASKLWPNPASSKVKDQRLLRGICRWTLVNCLFSSGRRAGPVAIAVGRPTTNRLSAGLSPPGATTVGSLSHFLCL